MNKVDVKMAMPSLLSITKRATSGFTLLEMLVVLFVLSIVSGSVIIKNTTVAYDDEMVHLMIENTKLSAIVHVKRKALPFLVDHVQLTYNAFGNINQSKSGQLSYPYKQNITFFLGYGAYEIK